MSNENTKQGMTIAEEAGLPDNWVPIDAPPIIPGMPSTMPANKTPEYLQGSLPPGYQHDASLVRTEYGSPNAPSLSLMPLGIQGNPTSNAAIQSTAQKAVVVPPSAPSTAELKATGVLFAVTDQTVTLPGPLDISALAVQAAGAFLAGPAVATGGANALDVDTTAYISTTSGSVSVSPTHTPELAIIGVAASASDTTSYAGWTVISGGTGTHFSFAYRQATISPFTQAIANSGGNSGVVLGLFGQTGTPALVQSVLNTIGTWTGSAQGTTLGSSVTSGNSIIVFVRTEANFHPFATLTVTDNFGNPYTNVGVAQNSLSNSEISAIYYSANVVGGASFTVTVSGPGGTFGGGVGFNTNVVVAEFSGVTAIPAPPTFRAIVGGDLPNPTTTSKGGVLQVAAVSHEFGTSIDATGKLILGQPAFTDISGTCLATQGGTGLATLTAHGVIIGEGTANATVTSAGAVGTFLAGKGASADPTFTGLGALAVVDLTAQTISLGPTTLYAVPVSGAGMYRVSYSLIDTTNGSAGTVTVTISWNNGAGSMSQTSATLALNGGAGVEVSGDFAFYSAASQNIQYTTTVTGLVGAQYSLRLRTEYLG